MTVRWGGTGVLLSAVLAGVLSFAQTDPGAIRPLRTAPTEKLTVKLGFRDWGPTAISGTTILGGNTSGSGGLYAVDMLTGKLKWSFHPASFKPTTMPAISGATVIGHFVDGGEQPVIGISLATGKELWRGPKPAQRSEVAVGGGLAYFRGEDGNFNALDAATGHEIWKVAFAPNDPRCARFWPKVREDAVYSMAKIATIPPDPKNATNLYLIALDGKTGKERWRYLAKAEYGDQGVCMEHAAVSGDTIFAAVESHVVAVDRLTGRERWKSADLRRPVEGRDRLVNVFGMLDAGSFVMGMTEVSLIAFDKASGKMAWEIPGAFRDSFPSMGAAGNVLYFQGSPTTQPAVASGGTLYAFDMDARRILWSFSRPTAEPNWPFGHIQPVDGGLWVDSYQALIKLQ